MSHAERTGLEGTLLVKTGRHKLVSRSSRTGSILTAGDSRAQSCRAVDVLHATFCGARVSDRQVVGEAVQVLDVAPREIAFSLDDHTSVPHEPGLGSSTFSTNSSVISPGFFYRTHTVRLELTDVAKRLCRPMAGGSGQRGDLSSECVHPSPSSHRSALLLDRE